MVQIEFRKAEWLPLLSGIFLALAGSFPYFLAVAKKQVPAFIPFIRHSAAYPPQSGIFSSCSTIAAFFGTMTLLLRYVAVKNRSFHVEHKLYEKLNKASLFIGFLFLISLLYTSVNPLGFRLRTKHNWIMNVLVLNHVGALCICLCFDTYALIQAYITYQQKRIFRKNVFIHALLSVCILVSTWTAIITITSSLKDEIGSLAEDKYGLVALEYNEYGFYSTICALSEWSFTFFGLLFILSFYNDFKTMTVSVQLKPKRNVCDDVELPTLRNQNNDSSKI